MRFSSLVSHAASCLLLMQPAGILAGKQDIDAFDLLEAVDPPSPKTKTPEILANEVQAHVMLAFYLVHESSVYHESRDFAQTFRWSLHTIPVGESSETTNVFELIPYLPQGVEPGNEWLKVNFRHEVNPMRERGFMGRLYVGKTNGNLTVDTILKLPSAYIGKESARNVARFSLDWIWLLLDELIQLEYLLNLELGDYAPIIIYAAMQFEQMSASVADQSLYYSIGQLTNGEKYGVEPANNLVLQLHKTLPDRVRSTIESGLEETKYTHLYIVTYNHQNLTVDQAQSIKDQGQILDAWHWAIVAITEDYDQQAIFHAESTFDNNTITIKARIDVNLYEQFSIVSINYIGSLNNPMTAKDLIDVYRMPDMASEIGNLMQDPSEIQDQDPSEVQDQDIPERQDQDPSEVQDQDPFKVQDQDPSQVQDQDPSEIQDQDIPERQDLDISEMPEWAFPEIQKRSESQETSVASENEGSLETGKDKKQSEDLKIDKVKHADDESLENPPDFSFCFTSPCRFIQKLRNLNNSIPNIGLVRVSQIESKIADTSLDNLKSIHEAESPEQANDIRMRVSSIDIISSEGGDSKRRRRSIDASHRTGAMTLNSLFRRSASCWSMKKTSDKTPRLPKPRPGGPTLRGTAAGRTVYAAVEHVRRGRMFGIAKINLGFTLKKLLPAPVRGGVLVDRPVVNPGGIKPADPSVGGGVKPPTTGSNAGLKKPFVMMVKESLPIKSLKIKSAFLERFLRFTFIKFGLVTELMRLVSVGQTLLFENLVSIFVKSSGLQSKIIIMYNQFSKFIGTISLAALPIFIVLYGFALYNVFAYESTLAEKIHTSLSFLPFVGCTTGHLLAVEKGKGLDAKEIALTSFCIFADAMMIIFPPLGAILKLVETLIRIFTAERQATFDQAKLQERYDKEWRATFDGTMKTIMDKMQNQTFTAQLDAQLKTAMSQNIALTAIFAKKLFENSDMSEDDIAKLPSLDFDDVDSFKLPDFPGSIQLNLNLCVKLSELKKEMVKSNERELLDFIEYTETKFVRDFRTRIIDEVFNQKKEPYIKSLRYRYGELHYSHIQRYVRELKKERRKLVHEANDVYKKLKLLKLYNDDTRYQIVRIIFDAFSFDPDFCKMTCKFNPNVNNTKTCLWTMACPRDPRDPTSKMNDKNLGHGKSHEELTDHGLVKSHLDPFDDVDNATPYREECQRVMYRRCDYATVSRLGSSIFTKDYDGLYCTKPVDEEQTKKTQKLWDEAGAELDEQTELNLKPLPADSDKKDPEAIQYDGSMDKYELMPGGGDKLSPTASDDEPPKENNNKKRPTNTRQAYLEEIEGVKFTWEDDEAILKQGKKEVTAWSSYSDMFHEAYGMEYPVGYGYN